MDDRMEHETPDATAPTPDTDIAFARLQAADPAAGSAPDMARLTAAVSERTGVDVATAEAAPVDELAARRAARTA